MPSKINYLLGIILFIVILIFNEPSFAINNPNLLPEEKTPVIDLAKILSPNNLLLQFQEYFQIAINI